MKHHHKREYIKADIERWSKQLLKSTTNNVIDCIYSFIQLMTFYPEYRSLFYYRIGWLGKILVLGCRPMPTLYICTVDIGPGLFIQHGFATIISAKKIGHNCWINQQVTIGFSSKDTDAPIIGNNVVINAGAKIIGKVKVGDNVIVGANAVVVKDVPENCIVVGVPAYIICRNGVKKREEL